MKYRVYLTCTALYYVDVEADTPENATRIGEALRPDQLTLSSLNDWAFSETLALTDSIKPKET